MSVARGLAASAIITLYLTGLAIPSAYASEAKQAASGPRSPSLKTSGTPWHASKLVLAGPAPTASTPVPINALVGKERFRVAVIASWCPTSQAMVDLWVQNPSMHSKIDLFAVQADEVERLVEYSVRTGEIDRAKADALLADPAFAGQLQSSRSELIERRGCVLASAG